MFVTRGEGKLGIPCNHQISLLALLHPTHYAIEGSDRHVVSVINDKLVGSAFSVGVPDGRRLLLSSFVSFYHFHHVLELHETEISGILPSLSGPRLLHQERPVEVRRQVLLVDPRDQLNLKLQCGVGGNFASCARLTVGLPGCQDDSTLLTPPHCRHAVRPPLNDALAEFEGEPVVPVEFFLCVSQPPDIVHSHFLVERGALGDGSLDEHCLHHSPVPTDVVSLPLLVLSLLEGLVHLVIITLFRRQAVRLRLLRPLVIVVLRGCVSFCSLVV
mmetsp:Transcript_38999/g.76667  ORF Transcript_38999/g.76667 Transcript_38999/m.76667 type:complete len:273 (-) Transcript_38999:294-1112(-)